MNSVKKTVKTHAEPAWEWWYRHNQISARLRQSANGKATSAKPNGRRRVGLPELGQGFGGVPLGSATMDAPRHLTSIALATEVATGSFTGRRVSKFGRLILQSMVAFAAAALFAFVFHRVLFAGIVAGIGLLILLVGLLMPRLHSALERFFHALAFGVGQVLTWLLLVPFYYLCFLPARIILALAKRDPMKRAWDSSVPTYWNEKHDLQDKDRMTRQY